MGKHALMVLAAAVVGYMIYHYSSNKGLVLDAMSNESNKPEEKHAEEASSVAPAAPAGENSDFASAGGMQTTSQGMPSSCAKKETAKPEELLPVQGQGNEFSTLNPNGSGDLQSVNLLKAGHHIGINTVGQSLRNANLQVRSEPANPQQKVSPWGNSRRFRA